MHTNVNSGHTNREQPTGRSAPVGFEVLPEDLPELIQLQRAAMSAVAHVKALLRVDRPRGVLPERYDARPRSGGSFMPRHEFRELQHRALMAERKETMPW